jgi:hypothetical protein
LHYERLRAGSEVQEDTIVAASVPEAPTSSYPRVISSFIRLRVRSAKAPCRSASSYMPRPKACRRTLPRWSS